MILTISSLGELTLLLGTSAEDGPGLPPNNVLVCVVGRPPNDVGVVPGCVTWLPQYCKKLMLKCEILLNEFHGLFQGVGIGMQDVMGK